MAEIKVGLSLQSLLDPRWQGDAELFKQLGPRMGVEVLIENANGGSLLQIEQCQKMLDQGVQVLLIVPQDAVKTGRAVELANQRKVPVIAYERMILDCDLPYFVGFDSTKIGQLQARYAMERAPRGSYFVIDGDEKDYNAVLIRKGRQAVLQSDVQKGNIKIAVEGWADGWRSSRARETTREALKSCPDPVAILGAADVLAEGICQALVDAKLQRPPVVTGQNGDLGAAVRILRGTQTMTIYKPLAIAVQRSLEAAIAIARGQRVPTTGSVSNGKKLVPSILLSDLTVVDRRNVLSVLTGPGGNTTLQQICAKLPRQFWPPEAAAAGIH